LVFDNSFSWSRAKRVLYMVEVITPADPGMRSEIQSMIEDQAGIAWVTEDTHL
jgi:hypothetical protein